MSNPNPDNKLTRTEELQNAVNISLALSEQESSLPMSVLSIQGYSGKKYKRFANTLLSQPVVRSYLEIGVLGGSTSIAGLYGNASRLNYWNIDNFCLSSVLGGSENIFTTNWKAHIKDCPPNLINEDCFSVDMKSHGIKNVDVYFYDGEHTEEDQYKALTYYYPAMSDSFIYMVDDWGWAKVKAGTYRAIQDMKFKVSMFVERTGADDHNGWWNGCGIFVLSK